MCVQAHVLVCVYIMYFYCSDVVMELSREIVLFGSEVLNSLWIILLEQLRINGIIVKEVWYRSARYITIVVVICLLYHLISTHCHPLRHC